MCNYEKYKRLCNNFKDEASGNMLPINTMTLNEQKQAEQAFNELQWLEA